MSQEDIKRINLCLDLTDPRHKVVHEMLQQCNKNKTALVVNAVLAYVAWGNDPKAISGAERSTATIAKQRVLSEAIDAQIAVASEPQGDSYRAVGDPQFDMGPSKQDSGGIQKDDFEAWKMECRMQFFDMEKDLAKLRDLIEAQGLAAENNSKDAGMKSSPPVINGFEEPEMSESAYEFMCGFE